MVEHQDGGPAFPTTIDSPHADIGVEHLEGMTLRDYFAAKAMQAILGQAGTHASEDDQDELHRVVAELAYRHADAMLSARQGEEVPRD